MVVTAPTGIADHQYHDLADDLPPGPGQTSVVRRRAPIACRRCRRMRSKCVHNGAQPPCKSCAEAGLTAQDCVFSPRGQPDDDRQYRHPRVRTNKSTKKDTAKNRRSTLDSQFGDPSPPRADDWDSLPPLNEMIEGVDRFTHRYFQLGFIPKRQFPEMLRKDHRSVDIFLLMSILSISARLTPSLVNRYGGGLEAAHFFMNRAAALAKDEFSKVPSTTERCQAFYLLSIAEQGNGMQNLSRYHMGHALDLATDMQLHREEYYQKELGAQPTPAKVIRAESERRTLWMLHSQDSLHSGPCSPVRLAAADITALLPSDETSFAAGRLPQSRAALADTAPARHNPGLIHDQNRSLFASLMQVHHYWGIVSRKTADYALDACPWHPESEFSQIIANLNTWEEKLPQLHTWNSMTLQHRKVEGLDLAYLGVTMVTRLCHIVARKAYLRRIIERGRHPLDQQVFYQNLGRELFLNVRTLYEQIDAQFTGRAPDEGVGAQMAAFCVYSCALFSAYLCKYPDICPNTPYADAETGGIMHNRCRTILRECREVWPLASRWLESLDNFFRHTGETEGSMADGKDAAPDLLRRTSSVSSSVHSPLYREPDIMEHLPPAFQQQQQHQQPILQASQSQPNTFSQPRNTYPIHPVPHGIQAQQAPQLQPDAMGFPAHNMAAVQHISSYTMMPATYDQTQAQNPVVSTHSFEMGSATAMASTASEMMNYNMGSLPDGFDDQLQKSFGGDGGDGGNAAWVPQGSWTSGC